MCCPESLAFGPVPSRRLGRSLGINNIPMKVCSYSCVYCQIGRTNKTTCERQAFYAPNDVYTRVKKRVDEIQATHEQLDYITFVPDGEPTLDLNLGREITLIKSLGYPVAVITNASLLWIPEVQQELMNADLVSIKLDALTNTLWRRVDRPNRALSHEKILDGIHHFSEEYKGAIITETMLLDGIDYTSEAKEITKFLRSLVALKTAYIAIPTRPPSEDWVNPAKEEVVNTVFQVVSRELGPERVEYLIGYEGDAFASTGRADEDVLSITAVHPMRKGAIEVLLTKSGATWSVIDRLLSEKKLVKHEYQGETFFLRKF